MKMMKAPYGKQSGMAALPVLLAIFGLILVIKVAFAVVPMYLQDSVVTQVLDTLQSSGEVTSRTRSKQLRALLERRLENGQADIPLDGLEIRRTRNGIVLFLSYEKRGNLFANIDLVGRFQHQKDFSQ
ncbi:MAG: DUF4845 domain-containing protein [Saccharospirillaceae bacterium]|jgi:hypothetical protein|nr:DUF4845 domain-containing protein [Saccharospirillaceae bacterium]